MLYPFQDSHTCEKPIPHHRPMPGEPGGIVAQFERIVNSAVEIKKADCLRVEGSRPVKDNIVAVVDFVDDLRRVQKGLDGP